MSDRPSQSEAGDHCVTTSLRACRGGLRVDEMKMHDLGDDAPLVPQHRDGFNEQDDGADRREPADRCRAENREDEGRTDDEGVKSSRRAPIRVNSREMHGVGSR